MSIKAAGSVGEVPVSGLAKVAQAFFGLLAWPSGTSTVVVNLIAGAIAESGSHSSQDLTHNYRASFLLNTPYEPQLIAMLLGTLVGGLVSSGAYVLYCSYYPIPGPLFQVPTAYVWVQAARLFTGDSHDMPDKAAEAATFAMIVFGISSLARLYSNSFTVQSVIPSATAFSIGKQARLCFCKF